MRKLVSYYFTINLLMSMPSFAETYRYLTIPTGGMLGLIPISLLEKIESETGKPIYQIFDGIAGTSTGAIICALLAVGYTAKDIQHFYQVQGAPVFKDAVFNAASSIVGRYIGYTPDFSRAANELKKQLTLVLDNRRMSDAKTELTILALNQSQNKIVLFNNSDNISMVDAVRASTSIANVFGPVQIMFNGVASRFIDASSLASTYRVNDATLFLANNISKKLKPDDKAIIYSLGTGFMPRDIRIVDKRITLIQITPSLEPLLENVDSWYVKLVDALAPRYVPMLKRNLLAAEVSVGMNQKVIAFAQRLQTTAEFKNMLADLKHVASSATSETPKHSQPERIERKQSLPKQTVPNSSQTRSRGYSTLVVRI